MSVASFQRKLLRRGWLLVFEIMLLAVGLATGALALFVAHGNLSTSLRVPNPSRTFFVGRGTARLPTLSRRDAIELLQRGDLFSREAAFLPAPARIDGQTATVEGYKAFVTTGMTGFLPARMALGRPLMAADFDARRASSLGWAGSEVVVSESLVRKLDLRSPLGSVVRTNGAAFRVVGVLPPTARFPYPKQPDMVIPFTRVLPLSGAYVFLGELRPGLTRRAAAQRLNRAAPEFPASAAAPERLAPIGASLDPQAVRSSELGLGLGTVALILLIATAMLMELLNDIRGGRERSVRMALGASPGRLARERALETAAVCALALLAGTGLIVLLWPTVRRVASTTWVSPRVDGFALASVFSLFAASYLCLALVPALLVKSWNALSGLKEEYFTPGRGAQRLKKMVVTAQIAASLALGLTAAALAGTLYALATEPLGVAVGGIWDAQLALPPADGRISGDRADALTSELRARLASLPGTVGVAFSSDYPAATERPLQTGDLARWGETTPRTGNVTLTYVDPLYLRLLHCNLLDGRYFDRADHPPDPTGHSANNGPVILSAPLARKVFGSSSPVGRRMAYLDTVRVSGVFSRVVGVVTGMKTLGLSAPVTEEVFMPLSGQPPSSLTVKMKGRAKPSLAAIQSVVSTWLPGARVTNLDSLSDRYYSELRAPRARLTVLAFFALLAVCVAAFGLASVLLTVVRERDREVGIRLALGAGRGDIAASLLRQFLPWLGLGLGLGLLAFALARSLLPSAVSGPLGPAGLFEGATGSAILLMLAVSVWAPLSRAFRRPINDLLREE